MKKNWSFTYGLIGAIFLVCIPILFVPSIATQAQALNPDPPEQPIKLIFIHHSCGENWLTDGNGNLGVQLGNNNYFVSDTNYGWGPNSIGDATDYYNWIDWFIGPESSLYVEALYNENQQHSNYTRPISDPGGENQIVMFKSCFPNSDLSGSPDDQAMDGEWMTVGHAKYVYNQLLSYFETRPDKLFIAITPPPLIDSTHAANAREFSRWLVEDWLLENNYPLSNVAIWDFHNILTHPDNHHRYQNGSIEYIISSGNGSLYYDSAGDDHPNNTGNQKATGEFIPMLNIFYNNWIAGGGQVQAPVTEEQEPSEPEPEAEQPEAEVQPQEPSRALSEGGIIDDFEGNPPPGTSGWESYAGDDAQSTLTCGLDNSMAHSGNASLRIDFNIAPDGWGTCPLMYSDPPDFSSTTGVAFDYHAASAGLLFNVDISGGTPAARELYFYTVEAVPESVDGWVHMEIPWEQIVGVDWEANAGVPINPAEINAFTFGVHTYEGAPNVGTVWVDNLQVIESAIPVQAGAEESAPAVEDEAEPAAPEAEVDQGRAAPALG